MHAKIHAKTADGREAYFTPMVWKAMGKNKHPWYQVNESGKEAKPAGSAAANEAKTEAKYRQLYEQGKSFAQDGKTAEAVEFYEAALAIKYSPYLKGQINKLREELEESKGQDARLELVANGEDAKLQGDYETALEFFNEAQKLEETEEVAALIAETEKQQKDALVE